MGEINWNKMKSQFVKLVNGQPKRMRLKNWREQTQFKEENSDKPKFGISFDVVQEDDQNLEKDFKDWTVTALKALSKLQPIIEKAEAQGKDSIYVSVLRAGEGKSTVYEITEIKEGGQ